VQNRHTPKSSARHDILAWVWRRSQDGAISPSRFWPSYVDFFGFNFIRISSQ